MCDIGVDHLTCRPQLSEVESSANLSIGTRRGIPYAAIQCWQNRDAISTTVITLTFWNEKKINLIFIILLCRNNYFYQFISNLYTVFSIYNFGYSTIYVGPAHWTSWARSRAATSNTSQLSRTCEVNLWEGTSHFSHARDQHVRDTKSIVFSVAKALRWC